MSDTQIKSIFQNFDDPSNTGSHGVRLADLREQMASEKLDAWLIPHADEYQNEYLPAYAERLAWLTGFTGSAGYCIVTCEDAVVFTDGRYTLQVADQIDAGHFTSDDITKTPPTSWLKTWLQKPAISEKMRIGFDPRLTTISSGKKLQEISTSNNAELIACNNLIDRIWHDQPHPPIEPVTIQKDKFSGQLALHKIDDLKSQLQDADVDLCIITDPSSIAWIFNIRGADTPHTPLPLGYAVLRADGYPLLFMDKRKMTREVEAYLTQLADIHPPSQLDEELAKISAGSVVRADAKSVSIALADIVKNNQGKLINHPDPVSLPRAIKNDAEITGSRNAHLRDGVAVTKFLYWLDQQTPGSVDEISAVKMLETIRRDNAGSFQSKLMDISFDTISGAGANGAIVHYRVTEKTNAILENQSLYLVDSGGQYEDGTTDITRTVAIGTPPPGSIEDFTLVLKGHIAIATARFPKGTRGIDIDCLARVALWQRGRDYAHGTGHGIGSYLSVHEGPQSISRRGMAQIVPGMIISNEPGFYREGQYGIRIENLVLVNQAKEFDDGNTPVMNFETLSMAPIDLRLIDPSMLNESDLHWLNAYHGWVKRNLSPHLNKEELDWLEEATAPLSNELPAASA